MPTIRSRVIVVWSLSFLSATFALATAVASVITTPLRELPPAAGNYSPLLGNIQSIDAAEAYIRAKLPPESDQAQAADAIERFTRKRFVHDLVQFNFEDDWLAWTAGLIWIDLRAPVLPDDLLKYRIGYCTQQTIVIEALFRRFNIDFATVGFGSPPHALSAAKIDGHWSIYYPDEEPNRESVVPFSTLSNPAVITKLYGRLPGVPNYGPGTLADQYNRAIRSGRYEINGVNRFTAPHAAIFQMLNHFLSRWGWALFAGMASIVHAGCRSRAGVFLPAIWVPAVVNDQRRIVGKIRRAGTG